MKRCYFHKVCAYAFSRSWFRYLNKRDKRERIIGAINFHEGIKKFPGDFAKANEYVI